VGNIILGAILGFLVAISKDIINYYFKNKKEQKKFYREKLEEIFTLTDKTQHTIYTSQTNILNDDIKSTGKFDDSNSKLAMLIYYYAPDIEKEFQDYLQMWANVGHYLVNSTINENLDQNEHLKQMQKYNEAYLEFKKCIREEAQKYI
jgi:hypothetical protein